MTAECSALHSASRVQSRATAREGTAGGGKDKASRRWHWWVCARSEKATEQRVFSETSEMGQSDERDEMDEMEEMSLA